jgi:cytochrome c oxidase assembly protein subunit 15
MNADPVARRFFWLCLVSFVLTYCVVVLGAYVRLSDAGLGCPDWPGCYGHLVVPDAEHHIDAANAAYPERPFEAPKAWKEMAHRYAAGTLGILVFGIALMGWLRRAVPQQPVRMPMILAAVVVVQAALGMWTVTLLLKPVIVTLHFIGGMTTLFLLWLLVLRTSGWAATDAVAPRAWRVTGTAVGILLLVQMILGAWVSTNYAALACPDFPTCQTAWVPPMDFAEGFRLWRGLGVDYEGGVLDNEARVAVHWLHRVGALVTTVAVGGFAVFVLVCAPQRLWRILAAVVLGALALQVSIGIMMVKLALPLALATLHNAGAALLMLAGTALLHSLHGWYRVRS